MIKLNTAKQAKKVMIATGVLSVIFLVGCNSQPSGKNIDKITAKELDSIKNVFMADQGFGVGDYEHCVIRRDNFNKSKKDSFARLDYSEKLQKTCETMFSNIQKALTKKGYSVTLAQVESPKLANKVQGLISQYEANIGLEKAKHSSGKII